jgi:hypothetical protein
VKSLVRGRQCPAGQDGRELAWRAAAISLRWSAGYPARRLAAVAGLACITMLAAFWTIQGQFHDW